MKFSIMTSPRYHDVTHFLTDSGENCTSYVKLNSKIFLFVEPFWFSEHLLRKLRVITKIPSIVQLPYTYYFSYPTVTLLFQHKKNSFYQKWWKPGSIPITPPPPHPLAPIWWGSSTRSPLIFWDTFPPYLRMLFQQTFFFLQFLT